MNDFCKKYLSLINNEFSGINLTRISSPDEFYNKQYLDSINGFLEWDVLSKISKDLSLMIDVGFGGGFPILPLADLFKSKSFVGFEARRKKADVVGEIAEILNLKNVRLFHQRFEKILIDQECLITFKAVSRIANLLPLIETTNVPVYVLFYKGPEYEQKEPKLNFKGWSLIGKYEYSLKHCDKRILLLYKNVPRGTNKVGSSLVTLSKVL